MDRFSLERCNDNLETFLGRIHETVSVLGMEQYLLNKSFLGPDFRDLLVYGNAVIFDI